MGERGWGVRGLPHLAGRRSGHLLRIPCCSTATGWEEIAMRLTLCTLVLALLAAAPAGGVTAHLVKDINTTAVSGSSGPAGYVVAGGLAYFSADDSLTGRELWRTDGTPAGTFEVVDACPGACAGSPRSVATNGSSYFFLASS